MDESYALAHFGKPLSNITLQDLNNFFATEHEETDTIEFKSYYEKNQALHNHKEAGVLKTICAFLNSSGGLLIWGAPVGQTPAGRQIKVFVGALSPVEVLIEKDTFISRLANRVIPLSNQVTMHQIEAEPGKYIYLFDVQQSVHKPHQFDNRYWVRLDGQTGIAPHYLIDALFKQISYPIIGGYIKFGKCKLIRGNIHIRITVLIMNHSKVQNEHDVYFILTSTKGKFVRDGSDGIYAFDDRQLRRDDFSKILSYSHGPFHNLVLQVPFHEINGTPEERKINLMLNFGGRASPMKRSDYALTIKSLGCLEHGESENVHSQFDIESEVNILMNDLQISEDERVSKILGR